MVHLTVNEQSYSSRDSCNYGANSGALYSVSTFEALIGCFISRWLLMFLSSNKTERNPCTVCPTDPFPLPGFSQVQASSQASFYHSQRGYPNPAVRPSSHSSYLSFSLKVNAPAVPRAVSCRCLVWSSIGPLRWV